MHKFIEFILKAKMAEGIDQRLGGVLDADQPHMGAKGNHGGGEHLQAGGRNALDRAARKNDRPVAVMRQRLDQQFLELKGGGKIERGGKIDLHPPGILLHFHLVPTASSVDPCLILRQIPSGSKGHQGPGKKMPTITTEAGPWNMTVFAYEEADPDNPLARLSPVAIDRLPFGAMELDRDGVVIRHTDTEPDETRATASDIVGKCLFSDSVGWAGGTAVESGFRAGVEKGTMNTVFDCAARGLPYRVRIHIKTSPILGTYWIFIKKLMRGI